MKRRVILVIVGAGLICLAGGLELLLPPDSRSFPLAPTASDSGST